MPYDPTPGGDQYYPSIQFDERGAPFQISASGKRSYIPPAAAATADASNPVGAKLRAWANGQGATYENPGAATPRSGFAHNTGTWDSNTGEWDGGNFFNTSLGGLILGGGAMAAPYAIGALSGLGGAGGAADAAVANAAAAGTGPATTAATTAATIPTTMGIADAGALGLPATSGLGSMGAIGGAAGAIPTTMGLASGDGVGTNVGQPSMDDIGGLVGGSGIGGGNGFPTSLLTDPKWSPLLKTLAGVGGLLGGKYLGDQASQNAVPPQLTQLLDLAMQRANSQTPLFNATQKGFYDMLPTFAKGAK